MRTLFQYLCGQYIINEGGMAGHMAHPGDYNELTVNDITDLIENLFSGKIENITEKMDGVNIQASMNEQGEVIFIRNKGDINSSKGGMTISDMMMKWADKPEVSDKYKTAGEIITTVFNKIGPKFFNPDSTTRRFVNCECIVEGVTNVMPYPSDQVDFHNIWIYKYMSGEWVFKETTERGLDTVKSACDGIESAMLTPKVIIDTTKESAQLAKKFITRFNAIMGDNKTIGEYKKDKFKKYVEKNYPWILDNEEGFNILFSRWFERVKKVNIRDIKKIYPEHVDTISTLDKTGYKSIVNKCNDELDIFFLRLGNTILKLCKGLVNNGLEQSVIDYLNSELTSTTNRIKSSANIDLQDKLSIQLARLQNLENQINPSEGIVFTYKGKMMKLTGSFAAINQILGSIKYNV